MFAMAEQEMMALDLFKDLTPRQVKSIAGLIREFAYQTGDILFEQGADASHFYILASGEVEVRYKPDDGPAIIVARVQRGGIFGWSAILGRSTYTSTAVCVRPAAAYRIACRDLRALCEQNPEAGVRLLERLASAIPERLRNTHRQILSSLASNIGENSDCARRVVANGY